METFNPSFSFAEYLVTFYAFIFGVVTTQFFSGWSLFITHRKELVISKEYLAWTFFAFLLLIDIWWASWIKTEKIILDNYLFYFSLISPAIFYLLTSFLFPTLNKLINRDLRMYLSDNLKNIAALFLMLFISFLAGDFVFGDMLKSDLIFNMIAIGVSIILYLYRPFWIRTTLLLLGICLLIYHLALMNTNEPNFRAVLGYSMLEYLTVFITFIYGFVASRYLNGWAMLLNNLNHIRISKMHLAWTFLAFGLMMDIWWNSYTRGIFMERNVLNFILTLSVPLMFYFLSAVLFPLELLKGTYYDFKIFFEEHKRSFSLLMGLILLSNIIIANMAESTLLLTIENFIRLGGILLSLGAAIVESKRLHQVVLIGGCTLLIVHSMLV
jgi:hypothetical protein